MMREAAARGHALLACEPRDLSGSATARVSARVRAASRSPRRAAPTGSSSAARRRRARWPTPTRCSMRKDPPFDSEYFYATHLLEQAEREGARVFNKPRGAARPSGEARDPRVPAVHRADARHARRGGDQALPRRAPRHHPEAARRHGRHGHLPRRPGRPEPRQHHRDAEPQRRADGDGAALPDRDHVHGDKRILVIDGVAGAARAGAHSAGQRDPRQPRRRRQGRGAAAVGARPRDRRGDRPGARGARPAAGRPRRDRRLPDRDQRHEPDRLPGDHAAVRLRRRRRSSSTRSSARSPEPTVACRRRARRRTHHGRPLPLQRPPRLRPRRPARRRRALARGGRAASA